MASFDEVEHLALALSEHERARLAKTLHESLPDAITQGKNDITTSKRQHVRSSMLRSIAYDAQNQLLEVVFRPGDTYRYENVPQDEYERLMKADSKGRYMQEHIIDRYPYHQLKTQH
jgi:hypothetical protein